MRTCLFRKKTQIVEIIKYLSASISVYMYLLTAMYVLVDMLHIDKVVAYVIAYFTAYILTYMMALLLVFEEQHRWGKVVKFVVYVVVSLLLSTLLYTLLMMVGVYYLLATFIAAIVLMPVRFFVNKYWVYR